MRQREPTRAPAAAPPSPDPVSDQRDGTLEQCAGAVGELVVVIKAGSQNGQSALVIEPNWNGRVKVRMLSGADGGQTKSYKPSELRRQALIGGDKPEHIRRLSIPWLRLRARYPLHQLCTSPNVAPGVLASWMDRSPTAALRLDEDAGQSPLHLLCINPKLTGDLLRTFVDRAPSAVLLLNRSNHIPFEVQSRHLPAAVEAAALAYREVAKRQCPAAADAAHAVQMRPVDFGGFVCFPCATWCNHSYFFQHLMF